MHVIFQILIAALGIGYLSWMVKVFFWDPIQIHGWGRIFKFFCWNLLFFGTFILVTGVILFVVFWILNAAHGWMHGGRSLAPHHVNFYELAIMLFAGSCGVKAADFVTNRLFLK